MSIKGKETPPAVELVSRYTGRSVNYLCSLSDAEYLQELDRALGEAYRIEGELMAQAARNTARHVNKLNRF